MSLAAFLSGSAVLLGMVGPLVFGAVRWRKRLLPGIAGVNGWVTDLMLTYFGVVLVAQVLGSFGAFRRWSVLAACIVAGIGAGIAAGRKPPTPRTQPIKIDFQLIVAFVVTALVVSRYGVGVLTALAAGPIDGDTQTYHLPMAAGFFQDGWLWPLRFPTVEDAIPYHPLNGEIVHAFGMLAFGRDLLTPLVNILWLIGCLAAAWAIGSHWGRPSLAVIGAAVPLATPIMTGTQGGSAMTDVVALFCFLAAVALYLDVGRHKASVALAGLGCGLAIGTKLTLVPLAAALTATAIATASSKGMTRSRFAVVWLAPMALGGGYWYLRNTVLVGNPLPGLRIRLGPISLPHPPMALVDRGGYSVVDYLFDREIWTTFFLPSFPPALGRAWFVVVALPIASLVLVLMRRTGAAAIGLIGLSGVVAYLFTPTTAFGLPRQPFLFSANLRYVVPSFVVGVVACASLRLPTLAELSYVGLILVPVLSELPSHWQGRLVEAGAMGTITSGVVAVLAASVILSGRTRMAIVVALGLVAMGSGYFLQESYLRARYQSHAYQGTSERGAFAWAQDIRGADIGMSGFFLNYPLYGSDLSNRVRYVGNGRPDGAFVDYETCAEWRTAVNRSRLDYLVVMPPFLDSPEPVMAAWTRTDPAVVEVFREERASVFRVDGLLDPSSCVVDTAPQTPGG